MNITDISTPALIVDQVKFQCNAEKMSALLENKTMKLRPHYKSHKCADIAHWQMKNGAIGLTCAKLDEAIDLADSGIGNILIANQITDKSKIAKMAYLAKACRLTVCKVRKSGTGCVYQINDHLWEGSYFPRLPDGSRKKFNVYAKTREECEAELAKMIEQKKKEIAELKKKAKTA